MSTWHEPKKEDLEVDGEDLNIYITSDDFGSVYAAVKIKDIEEVIKEYRKCCEKCEGWSVVEDGLFCKDIYCECHKNKRK